MPRYGRRSAPIDPAGDASLQERLHHVHVVQRIYLQLWQDLPHEVRELSTFTTLDDVRAWARDETRSLPGSRKCSRPSRSPRPDEECEDGVRR
jgi:hypothetical protein